MTKLADGITILNKERRRNTKASESYVEVRFVHGNHVWNGWVPVEYRRTGVDIAENDEEGLIKHLNNIYTQMNPDNYEAWLKKKMQNGKTVDLLKQKRSLIF